MINEKQTERVAEHNAKVEQLQVDAKVEAALKSKKGLRRSIERGKSLVGSPSAAGSDGH